MLPREFARHEDLIDSICEGALKSRDVEAFLNIDEWICWLSWSAVLLNKDDYLTAAVHALDLAPRLARTDYGGTRQRDLGQLWTDTIRGFLGEIAFAKWLDLRFGTKVELDYRKGPLEEYLPSDVKAINGREPRLHISIKTTQLKGIWLDIPYKQIEHSDIFVLVRIGVTKDHFLAFLKEISAIGDKLLKEALKAGLISNEEAKALWDNAPSFADIPSYIVGFFDKREYGERIKDPKSIFTADGRLGPRRKTKFTINKFVGYWDPKEENEYKEVLFKVLEIQGRPVPQDVKLEFESIGHFSKTLHFIVSSGVLKRREEEWASLVREL